MTNKTSMYKVCEYGVADDCIKRGKAEEFHGKRCKACNLERHREYYQAHRKELLHRANRRYAEKMAQANIEYFEKEFAEEEKQTKKV